MHTTHNLSPFDEVIDRTGTDSIKVDALQKRFGREDLLSLWVADMDFRTPAFITDALKERCDHGIFGYTFAGDAYYDSIIRWLQYKHAWTVAREWLCYIPGIVKGIAFALQCFTKEGDKVIIQPPVYHPFRLVPEGMRRKVVFNPLKMENGRYVMDFAHLESVIDGQCKALILCSPHNPGGVVWDEATLAQLADICARHQILILADEIHSEMVYPGYRHHPFPTVSAAASANSITFMAPSKTFNIAGIVASYAVVPDETLRRRFFDFLRAGEFDDAPLFSYIATQAAYTHGAEWVQQMLAYVQGNIRFVEAYLAQHIPQIRCYPPQASFLLWLDCRDLGLPQKELVELFINKAGLALNDGAMFGAGGEGYMRLNVASPQSVLQEAMHRLKRAVNRK